MNNTEATTIIGIIRSLCPSQKFDEITAAVWAGVMQGISEADAKAAVKVLGMRLRYIAPSDIMAEVKIMRSKRLAGADATFIPPAEIQGESEASYARRTIEAKREHLKNVADGVNPPRGPELTRGFEPEKLMRNVFRDTPQISRIPCQRARGM